MSLLAWSFLEFRVATNVRKLTGSKRIYFWQVVQKQESRVHLAFCHQCILYIHDISLHFIIMWFDILYLYRTIVCNHISKCSYPHIMFTNSHGLFFFYATWQPWLSARLLPMGLPEDVTVIAWGIGCERWTALLYNIRMIKDTSKSLNFTCTYTYTI